jgi:hypothetical protein
MTHRSFLITLLSITLLNGVILGAGLLHAQEAGPRPSPAISTEELSRIPAGTMPDALGSPAHVDVAHIGVVETHASQTQESGGPPAPLQIVVQFLQLQPHQVQEFQQLVQSRQAVIAALLDQIQQRTQQLDKLLNSGGNPQQVGVLVIQIHVLQQKVIQVQQDFLSRFVGLLDNDQRQRLETVRIAYQLQPILPAFEQLNLL